MKARLKTLLYILLRDEIPVGVMNRILDEHVNKANDPQYSDKFIEAKVEDIIKELDSGLRRNDG